LYISLGDLGLFILFIIAVTAGIFLIIVLVQLMGLLKKVRFIVDKNEQNLDQSLNTLPKVMDNVNEATEIIKNGLYKTEGTIDALTETFFTSASAVETKTEAILSYVAIVSEVAKGVYDFFSKAKESK